MDARELSRVVAAVAAAMAFTALVAWSVPPDFNERMNSATCVRSGGVYVTPTERGIDGCWCVPRTHLQGAMK